jgi:hypothetical protein
MAEAREFGRCASWQWHRSDGREHRSAVLIAEPCPSNFQMLSLERQNAILA